MAKSKVQDQYPQFMSLAVTQSAANTLTFGHVAVGTSIFDYAAFLIHRIEIKLARAAYNDLKAVADQLTVAICGSNTITDIYDFSNPQIYDIGTFVPIDQGTVASFLILEHPMIHDFTGLPGGGILVPAQDIYIGCQTSGFAAAATATVRLYYTIKALEASDYIELAQRLRVLST